MRETLALMLRVAEEEGPASQVWPHAALRRLPAADVDRLMRMGLLAEMEPDTGLTCTECGEACQVEPTMVATGGRARGFHLCRCSSEHAGPVWFEMDELRRWELRLGRLADVVAKAIGAVGGPAEVQLGRLYLLGTARIDGKTREVFLARGAAWPDAAEVFGRVPRLGAPAEPVVLSLACVPAGDLLPGRTLPVRPLVEIVEASEAGLVVRLDGAFPDIRPDAWAGIPNKAITLDAFMARYCEKRSGELRRFRRHALLGAARNGKVTLPPAARPHRSGQSKKYFTHDLLAAWQGFLDERVDLPPLLPQFRPSHVETHK